MQISPLDTFSRDSLFSIPAFLQKKARNLSSIFRNQIAIPSRPATFDTLREMGRKAFSLTNPLPVENEIDWKARTDQEVKVFIKKASMLVIVKSMNGHILDESIASQIVQEAYQTHQSVSQIYFAKLKKDLSLLDKLSARWNYFIFAQCGIAENTIQSLVDSFLLAIRQDLIEKGGGKNLAILTDKILSEASSFLSNWLKTNDDFIKGAQLLGSRDAHISHMIAQMLKQSPYEISHLFASTIIRRFLPRISFFQRLQNSSFFPFRWMGMILDRTVGFAVNQLVHYRLKAQIPQLIASFLKTSEDMARPSNLPFTVSITQGILEQLRNFRIQIEKQPISQPSPHGQGAEKLPEVVKNLIDVLHKVPLKTRKELREQDKNKSQLNIFDPQIQKGLENSIINGGSIFCSHISDPNHSEEILYRLFNLSIAPLESLPPTTSQELRQLQDQIDALKKEMHLEASEVFHSILSHMQKIADAHISQLFHAYETEQKSQTSTAIQELWNQTEKISSKIPQNSIIDELDQMVHLLERFQTQAILSGFQQFPDKIKKGIDSTLGPIYLKFIQLLDAIGQAKQVQLSLSQNQIHFEELEKFKKTFLSQRPFQLDPAYGNRFPASHPILMKMQTIDFTKLIEESQSMEALLSLGKKGGVLAKLYALKLRHAKTAIRPDLECQALIQLLSGSERPIISEAIHRFCQSTSTQEMEQQWNEMKLIFERLGRSHSQKIGQERSKHLSTINEIIEQMKKHISTEHQQLQDLSQSMQQLLWDLKSSTASIQIIPVESLPMKIIDKMGGAAATIGLIAGGAIGWGLAQYWGAGASPSQFLSEAQLPSSFQLRPIIETVARQAATIFPNAASALSTAVGGLVGRSVSLRVSQKAENYLHENVIFPPLMQIFDNFYEFILQPDVRQWIVWTLLQCFNEVYCEES